MSLNLIKLCVGCDSVEDLEEWIAFRLDERRRAGEPAEHWHTTRMVPTRGDEITDGGSLTAIWSPVDSVGPAARGPHSPTWRASFQRRTTGSLWLLCS